MTGLILVLLALWLASEICAWDISRPEPEDPFRLDRWRGDHGDGDPPQDL